MAVSVVASVLGGDPKRLVATTVGEVKGQLQLQGAYTAQVNGDPADDGDALSPEDFVSFAPAVKGGTI